MNEHPYTHLRNTKLWAVIEKAVVGLEENQDLKITTPAEYVIGYIYKQLADYGVSVDLNSD